MPMPNGAPEAKLDPEHWLHDLLASPTLIEAADRLRRAPGDARALPAAGGAGSSASLVAGALAYQLRRPVLHVVAHLDEADDAAEDLAAFDAAGAPIETLTFGALESAPGESAVSIDLLAERIDVVERLARWREAGVAPPAVIVAPIQALMQAAPPSENLDRYQLMLQPGMQLPPARLLDWLERAGYTRVDAIEQPGDVAVRGGIVDLFPPASVRAGDPARRGGDPQPIRLDYFGDEIETLAIIDLDTMGSIETLDTARLVGAAAEHLAADEAATSLVHMLPPETLVVMSEVLELAEQARGYYERLIDPRGVYAPRTILAALDKRPGLRINSYAGPEEAALQLPVAALPSFAPETDAAIRDLLDLAPRPGDADRAGRLVVLAQQQGELDRLAELLEAARQASIEADPDSPRATASVEFARGYLHRGFVWRDPAPTAAGELTLVPVHELLHRYETRRRIRRVTTAVDRAADAFVDLAVGDYVVHVDHGVARFVGLVTLRRKGKSEDYLTLEFAKGARLHVPATQIDLVQKYIGGAGSPPLSTLGGKRWSKQKEAAAEAAKELAAEMLRIQAARAAMPGVRYPADTPWQREFEAAFPYDETDDQLAAIAAVKKDMGDEQPMDRLICGDVGFGKTEVAIRAAFKAAEFGKQVAILVPTTVLAEQHERTIRSRMAEYPFRIESVSRFRTAGEVRQTLEALRKGQIDILIGTHRLLSEDVRFADLGLVIIDEEQRFGVEHKQKLLRFRLTADVLTLTATPIPRTLHLSLLGLRDISSLSTAPADRRAIVTEVMAYDRKRVQHALVRELSREGQVYFVHNRVHDIHEVADEVQKLVPDARVIIGHGQMPAGELEKVMLDFTRREADILVCTTIIESGIDIPTANTMIIHDADHFGLADLHQLRGRVGRYKHRAYCYLLMPEKRPVTDVAARRLRAIEQFSMLGAGFKIAMRDLEIRGAGNILGAEQSGHIAAVGYEMYCSLLEQEARKLRDGAPPPPIHTHLELPAEAVGAAATGLRITKDYIRSDKLRLDAYRRISRASSIPELRQVVKDLTDAFGKPPAPAESLLAFAELRIAAGTVGVASIKLEGPDLIFKTQRPQQLDPLLRHAPGRTSVIDHETIYYRPPENYLEPGTLMAVLRKLIVRPVERASPPANEPPATVSTH